MSDDSPYPIPTFLSDHAKAVLAAPLPQGQNPALDDTDGWLQLIAYGNAGVEKRFGDVELPVTIEPREIAGVPVYVIRSAEVSDEISSPLLIDIHGGALIIGGGALAGLMAAPDALASGMLTWAPDYRMPPLHPYPAGLDDVLAVYRAALDVRSPEEIAIAGTSAGGNLAAAVILRIKDEGLPTPGSLVLLSPEVDLTESGDTFQTLAKASNTLGSLRDINQLYAAGVDLTDPYVSPLFGDLTGFPPTFVQAGTRDLFLSNAVRFHRKLRTAGVDAELHVFEAMPHGGFAGAPEDEEVGLELRRFLDKHHPRV
ncbi:alpha/beta hydrolase [uncultured Microbacterium sp.]|uniref:alpha/beta hydrolase n=1 Tax=uncultured Microbacterium sp. TaxID=191216 RepID=UPI0035CC4450